MSQNESPADRLERALRDQEERKKSAAALAEKMAPERERMASLHAQLEKLPQHERRAVLDAAGLQRISAVPAPLEPIRSSGYMPQLTTTKEPPAVKWQLWLHMPQVKLWEAVALVLGIEPGSLKHSESGWMAGPGCGPFFELRSFPSPKKRTEFDDAILLAERAANYDGPPIHVRLPERNKRTAMVSLREVVAFFIGCGYTDIPAPLVTLAEKRPPALETAPSASTADSARSVPLQEAGQPDAQDRASVSTETVSVGAVKASTAGAGGKLKKPRRSSWWEEALPHFVEKLRGGKYQTMKELSKAIENEAGSPDSPFDIGEGNNRGKLVVRKSGQAFALKTTQNRWSEVRAAAGLA